MLHGTRYAADPELVRIVRDELPFMSWAAAEEFYADYVCDMTLADLAFLGANDRYFLLTNILRRQDASHPWLYERCREVEADPDNHLDLWARYHYKSTIVTFAGSIQEIIRDPEITIGIFSVNKPVALPFLRQIQEELESNPHLPEIYGDVFWRNPRREAPLWSRERGIVVRRQGNPKEATVEAYGLIDAMPTGRHFALRIYDDLINETLVSNEEQVRKATLRWEMSQNLGTAHSNRRWHVGTRYAFGDTYGVLLERQSVEPRIYPATEDGTLRGAPVFLSQEQWEQVKRDQRSTAPAQMLLNPTAGLDNSFRPEWLRPFEVRPATMTVYILGDPSLGRNATSDRTAIAVIGIDVNANRYLLDGACHRMNAKARWSMLRDLWRKWHRHPGVQAVHIGWERYGLQTDTEYFEEKVIDEKLTGFPEIQELNWVNENDQSKKGRVGRLQPYFEDSQFLVPAKVWHRDRNKTCTWRIGDAEAEGTALASAGSLIIYEDCTGPSKAERRVLANGERARIVTPIRRLDGDGAPYDVTRVFFEQFVFFPFSPHDDMIDAVSRIEDMNPTPPVLFEAMGSALRQRATVD